jgi:hypothetical protein
MYRAIGGREVALDGGNRVVAAIAMGRLASYAATMTSRA